MWLFTKYGFYSPVCARKGDGKKGNPPDPKRIMVRARAKEHLEALVKRFPDELGGVEIRESRQSDYPCRLFVDKAVWVKVVAALAEETDYDNFKSKVFGHQGATAYEHVLHEVWGAMHRYQHRTRGTGTMAAPQAPAASAKEYRPLHASAGGTRAHQTDEPTSSMQGGLPFARTWWIEPGAIIGGPYPGSPKPDEMRDKMHALVAAGVRRIVTLQQPGERNNSGEAFVDYLPVLREECARAGVQVTVASHPITDQSIPSQSTMAEILARLREAVDAKELVYVHCYGGHGRTATVAGCWMVEQGMSPGDALKTITERRKPDEYLRGRRSPETSEQAEFVRKWKAAGCKPKSKGKPKGKAKKPKKSKATPEVAASKAGGRRGPAPSGAADRLRGALLGLAVGDAIGTTVEFKPPGSFQPVTDMVGGGPFGLAPGQWTDDTSMALCLAESIVETQGFDPADQLARYVDWWRNGHLSSTGRCFDIGNQTAAALSEFERTGAPFCGGPLSSTSAGNGSLMRLAPVPMAFRRDPAEAVRLAGESSRTTHGARECVDACRYFAGLLVGLFAGASKDEVLAPMYAPVPGLWEAEPLAEKVAFVAGGSFLRKSPPQIRGLGYVVLSLEAALWAFARHDRFESAVLAAVNLGDDADTTAAICGQVAGACWGASSIPAEWLEALAMRDVIEKLAEGLIALGPRQRSVRRVMARESE